MKIPQKNQRYKLKQGFKVYLQKAQRVRKAGSRTTDVLQVTKAPPKTKEKGAHVENKSQQTNKSTQKQAKVIHGWNKRTRAHWRAILPREQRQFEVAEEVEKNRNMNTKEVDWIFDNMLWTKVSETAQKQED